MHHLRTRALEDERVRRAAALYPHEPIVRMQWPTGRTTMLWQRGEDALGPRMWQVLADGPAVMGKPVPRALPGPAASQQAEEEAVLFEGEDFTITEMDVEHAIEQGRERVGDAFAELLTARALTEAEIDALDGGQHAD
jgi:hypothetical protein